MELATKFDSTVHNECYTAVINIPASGNVVRRNRLCSLTFLESMSAAFGLAASCCFRATT